MVPNDGGPIGEPLGGRPDPVRPPAPDVVGRAGGRTGKSARERLAYLAGAEAVGGFDTVDGFDLPASSTINVGAQDLPLLLGDDTTAIIDLRAAGFEVGSESIELEWRPIDLGSAEPTVTSFDADRIRLGDLGTDA